MKEFWIVGQSIRPLLKTITKVIWVLLLAVSSIATAKTEPRSDTPPVFERKPRWEAGLGGGYIEGFDYPASRQSNYFGGLLPYAIYRSERIRFTGRGLSAIAVEDSRFKLDVSMAVSLSADSEGNALRAGMPDLDYLFELGPQLVTRLINTKTDNATTRLNWSNRIRTVVSTDFSSVKSRGWVFQSQLQWRREKLFSNRIDLFATLSFTWASEKLQDYFYEVDQNQVTSFRPEYDAKAGYLGTTLFAGVGLRPLPDWRLFVGVNHGHFGNSANKNSPLYETDSSTGIAIGLVWTILKSDDTILVLDDE